MSIRFDGKLNSEIKRVVSNFNRKVKRLESKGVDNLPDTILVSELKQSFGDRRELLRELNRLSSFNKRGAEQVVKTKGGATTTKWELENLAKQQRIAKLRLTKQIKKEMIAETKLRGSVSASLELNRLRASRKKLDTSILEAVPRAFESIKTTILNEFNAYRRMKTFQQAYVDKIMEVVAFANSYSKQDLMKIQEKLLSMSPEKFYEMYKESRDMQNIFDIYEKITNSPIMNFSDDDDFLSAIKSAGESNDGVNTNALDNLFRELL